MAVTGEYTHSGTAGQRAVTSILVVDDDPQVVRVLLITLAAHGYTVLTASDGRTALRSATEYQPAAIILDCGLPDIDGLEVIAQLRRWSSVPIIVFSARSSQADQNRALRAGADAYVTKPASTNQLVGQLQAVLDYRDTARQVANELKANPPSA
jgi:two-component system KDP operon response regulator KdpE